MQMVNGSVMFQDSTDVQVLVPDLWTPCRVRKLERFGLIAVTGTSALDRAEFIDLLQIQFPATKFLSLVTTREVLPTDRPDQYRCLSKIRSSREVIDTGEISVASQSRKHQFFDLGQSRGYAWRFLKRGAYCGAPLPAFHDAMLRGSWPMICELELKCASQICASVVKVGASPARVCMVFIRTSVNRLKTQLLQQLKDDPEFTTVCMEKRLLAREAEERHAMSGGYPYHLIDHRTDDSNDMMVRFGEILDHIAV